MKCGGEQVPLLRSPTEPCAAVRPERATRTSRVKRMITIRNIRIIRRFRLLSVLLSLSLSLCRCLPLAVSLCVCPNGTAAQAELAAGYTRLRPAGYELYHLPTYRPHWQGNRHLQRPAPRHLFLFDARYYSEFKSGKRRGKATARDGEWADKRAVAAVATVCGVLQW